MRIDGPPNNLNLRMTDHRAEGGQDELPVGLGNHDVNLTPEELNSLLEKFDKNGTFQFDDVTQYTTVTDVDVDGTLTKLNTALDDVMAGSEGALDALKSLLGQMGIGDDLSTLMVEFAAMGRQNALDQRLASREQAKDELMSQAEATRAAAITQVVVAAVTLVVSVVTTGLSLNQASKAGETSKQLGKLADEGGENQAKVAEITNAAAKQQTQNQAWTQVVSSIGQTAEGAGGLASGLFQAGGQVDAANAQMEQSNSDLSKKVMDDFEEMVRATIQFLKEMQQAETDLMANMTRV